MRTCRKVREWVPNASLVTSVACLVEVRVVESACCLLADLLTESGTDKPWPCRRSRTRACRGALLVPMARAGSSESLHLRRVLPSRHCFRHFAWSCRKMPAAPRHCRRRFQFDELQARTPSKKKWHFQPIKKTKWKLTQKLARPPTPQQTTQRTTRSLREITTTTTASAAVIFLFTHPRFLVIRRVSLL